MRRTETQDITEHGSVASRLGAAVAVATSLAGLVAAATAITTPPRSGPFCRSGCLTYPYTDAAAFVPRDYWWIYPQSVFVLLALVLLVCLHQQTAPAARVFTAIAAGLATVATATLLVDYAIQLAVLQPSLRLGETGGLSLYSQYNPHGVFIALEDLGYLLLGLALAAAAAAFTPASRLERGLRWVLLTGGALTAVALPVLALSYGAGLEYRYEVAAITLTWLTLVAGGIPLSRWFRRARPPAT